MPYSSLTGRASRVADLPAVVAEEMVLVAKIGATVAAATGVPVLKIVFCGEENPTRVINKNISQSSLKAITAFDIANFLSSFAQFWF